MTAIPYTSTQYIAIKLDLILQEIELSYTSKANSMLYDFKYVACDVKSTLLSAYFYWFKSMELQ